MDLSFVGVTQSLLQGFVLTCLLFFFTLIFALPLGLVIAFGTMSKNKVIKSILKVFVWVIRGIPLMLQVFVIFYGPGLFSMQNNFWARIDDFFFWNFGIDNMGAFFACLIAFIINYACYFSEIYRGGIESISKGQYEAGEVLGLNKKQVFRKIILMQVIKRIVPPMSNEIITLVKDTALSNSIGVMEILLVAKTFTRYAVWPIFYSGVFYLLFVGILTIVFSKLEKKLSYYKV